MKLNIGINFNSKPNTQNMEGVPAYKMTPKVELYQRVLSCFWNEPKFYGNKDAQRDELILLAEAVAEKEPEYVFQLAAYARNVFNLRTVSVALFVIASNEAHGTSLPRKYVGSVIKRADEIAEALAFQINYSGNGKKAMPNNLRRALADIMENFDAYAYAKYSKDGQVKLKDALKIVHPKPHDKAQSKIYKDILNDTLKPAKTWEVTLSTWQENFESKKDAWNSIIPTLPIFATVRNLRNILGEKANVKLAIERLQDERTIRNSRMLPFRFYSAYKEIKDVANPFTSSVMDALSDAMDYSLDNVPEMKGVTVIAIDHSGSMGSPLSEHSTVMRQDAANALAGLARAKSRLCILMEFATEARIMNVARGKALQTIAAVDAASRITGGTDIGCVFDLLAREQLRADRVIILTDEQENEGSVEASSQRYKSMFPECKIYIVNLAGYGMTAFRPKKGIVMLAGFSEKLFQFVQLAEQDYGAMIKEIEHYEPKQPKTEDED